MQPCSNTALIRGGAALIRGGGGGGGSALIRGSELADIAHCTLAQYSGTTINGPP